MALPKLVTFKFAVKLPSSGQMVEYRPFLVKEEKALLMASEADDEATMIRSIREAINSCVEGVDVTKIPYFDVEYLFLNLRAKSVGEEIKLRYKHRDGKNREGIPCDVSTEVSVNLDDVKVKFDPNHTTKFMIDDKLGIQMKYPTIDSLSVMQETKDDFRLMAGCIDFVYSSEDVYPPDSLEDSIQFIESMNAKQFEKLTNFFETMPKLHHKITYSCDGCGQSDDVEFERISDFF